MSSDSVSFLKKGFCLACLFVAVDACVPFAYLDALRRTGIGLSYQLPASDVLILGASHTAFAVDDTVWTSQGVNVLHCSRDGQFSEFFWSFYDAYRRHNPAPRLVVIDAPFFMFQKSHYESLLALGPSFDLEGDYGPTFSTPSSRLFAYGEAFQIFPSIAFRRLRDKDRVMDCGRAAKLYPDFERTDLVKRGFPGADTGKRIRYDEDGWSMVRNPVPAAFLERFVARLSQEGVAALLVETPEFIDTQRSMVGKEQFYADIHRVMQGRDRTRFFKEDQVHSIDVTDPRQFYDGGWGQSNSHLSRAGSRAYTAELLGVVRAMLNTTGEEHPNGTHDSVSP